VAYLGGAFGRSPRGRRGGKIFLCVCVGGREEQRREEREDVDEGRSGDWLEIGEISKKKVVKKFYIDV
jgi:hypothetical protein